MSFLKDKNPKGSSDFLKTIVILGLPFVHAMMLMLAYGQPKEELYSIAVGIGGLVVFGSPVFLYCLGIDLLENRSAQSIIKMGIQISIINILFNLVRYSVPEAFMTIPGYAPATWLIMDIFAGDIYCFVGLFCIFYGLTKKFKWSLGVFSLVSLAMFVLNMVLQNHILPVSDVVSYILGNFVSGYMGTFFSFLGWCIFPCIGFYIGKAMKLEKKKRDTTFGIILLGTVAAVVIYSIILGQWGTNIFEIMSLFAFYRTFGIMQAISLILAGLLVISLMYFIYGLIPENKFEKKVIMCSNLIMPFYLIHVIILSWLIVGGYYFLTIIGKEPLSYGLAGFWIVSIGTLIATSLLCYWKGFTFTRWLFKITDYQRWFKKKKKKTA